MVSSLWPPVVIGGAELYAAELTDRLRREGHEVRAVTLGIEGADVEVAIRPRPVGVQHLRTGPAWRRPVFHANDIWRPDVSRAMKAAISRFQPDVVHSHVTQGMSAAALAAPSRAQVAHVHTLHDFWLRCWRSTLTSRSGGGCGPACRMIAAQRLSVVRRHRPGVVIGISQAMLDQHPSVRGRAGNRVLLHPVGAEARRARRPSSGNVVFGYLGQLTPNKGVSVLLEAARLTPHTVRFAGAGRLLPDVEAAAAAGEVEYLGWVAAADKERFFDSIDCLVVPSVWHEPAGLVVNEAIARGIPVLASNTGGLPEYVPVECRPLLSTPGDAAALATAMNVFASDPASFQPAAPDSSRSWSAHLGAVLDSYAAARRVAAA